MIKIIAIGKKTEYQTKINDYIKRLKKPFNIEFKLLDYSSESGDVARENESKNILKLIDKKEYVILLDERGDEIDNKQLLAKLTKVSDITIVIGGPYGVNIELRQRANFMWSLGKLVLPYEVVRLILVEQIYRSQCINSNHPYHHV